MRLSQRENLGKANVVITRFQLLVAREKDSDRKYNVKSETEIYTRCKTNAMINQTKVFG